MLGDETENKIQLEKRLKKKVAIKRTRIKII
jgi:hypothetical protein